MTYDLVIRNGTVVDGTGMAPYRADVGIARGRIATIGRIRDTARRTSTPRVMSSRRALSTATPTSTPRSSGTGSARTRAGTA